MQDVPVTANDQRAPHPVPGDKAALYAPFRPRSSDNTDRTH